MFIELAKKLRDIDSNLSLMLSVDNTLFTLGVYNPSENVAYYSFSSTDLLETYQRVNKYISCLGSATKMSNFVEEVTNGNWEVVNV